VTLAIQNSALTLIMHYSLVSTPPSRTYSAATAVLLNEILKGAISLAIAYSRIDTPVHSSPYPLDVNQAAGSHWVSVYVLRARILCSEIFSPDCWKLSIPAILYGKSFLPLSTHSHVHPFHCNQSSKTIYNTLQRLIYKWRPSK
jgi:UDP-sugar transporter A1/2/3